MIWSMIWEIPFDLKSILALYVFAVCLEVFIFCTILKTFPEHLEAKANDLFGNFNSAST